MGSTADWQSTIANLRELLRKFADDPVGYDASVALIEGFTDAFEHAENLAGAPLDELEDLLL
jgi:hypothetical protein